MYLKLKAKHRLAANGRSQMSIGQVLERPALDLTVNPLVLELMEQHEEVLVIGVRPLTVDTGKHTLAIYIKAAENGGHLLPYLRELVEELVERHERAAESKAASTSQPY